MPGALPPSTHAIIARIITVSPGPSTPLQCATWKQVKPFEFINGSLAHLADHSTMERQPVRRRDLRIGLRCKYSFSLRWPSSEQLPQLTAQDFLLLPIVGFLVSLELPAKVR